MTERGIWLASPEVNIEDLANALLGGGGIVRLESGMVAGQLMFVPGSVRERIGWFRRLVRWIW